MKWLTLVLFLNEASNEVPVGSGLLLESPKKQCRKLPPLQSPPRHPARQLRTRSRRRGPVFSELEWWLRHSNLPCRWAVWATASTSARRWRWSGGRWVWRGAGVARCRCGNLQVQEKCTIPHLPQPCRNTASEGGDILAAGTWDDEKNTVRNLLLLLLLLLLSSPSLFLFSSPPLSSR